MDEKPKSKRGFASMSPEKRREIAGKGGQSVAKENRSFSRDRKLAATAGRTGGLSVPGEKRSFSQDKDLAQSAGMTLARMRATGVRKHPRRVQRDALRPLRPPAAYPTSCQSLMPH